jgi:hypothetical protein
MNKSVEIVRVEPCFTAGEQEALAGFLSGYRGLTRDAYALDLRQFRQLVFRPFSQRAVPTSNASPGISRRRAKPGQRWPGVSARRGSVPLRRRRGIDGSLARCACPSASPR